MFLEKGVAAFPDVAAAVSEGRSLRQAKGGGQGNNSTQKQTKNKDMQKWKYKKCTQKYSEKKNFRQ